MWVYVIPCLPHPIYKLELSENLDQQTKQLREVVGGHLEVLTTPVPGVLMWMNEEGRRLGLPDNVRATVLATHNIVGNVVVTGQDGPDIAEPPLEITEHWGGSNGH